jgi:hypothetical protein
MFKGPSNKFRQAGNRFLGSLKYLQIRALMYVQMFNDDIHATLILLFSYLFNDWNLHGYRCMLPAASLSPANQLPQTLRSVIPLAYLFVKQRTRED